MNWALMLACIALAVLAVWISRRHFANFISPFSVFYVAWFASLALYHAGWIAYTPVRQSTWLLIGSSLVAFGAGWVMPYLAWNPREVKSLDKMREQISEERLYLVIVVCFVLGVIGLANFLYSVQSTLGLATYVEAPHEIRQAMASGGEVTEGIKPFNWLNVSNVVLASLYLFAIRGGRRRFVWMVLIFSVMAVLLMEDRTRFFYAALWAGFLAFVFGRASTEENYRGACRRSSDSSGAIPRGCHLAREGSGKLPGADGSCECQNCDGRVAASLYVRHLELSGLAGLSGHCAAGDSWRDDVLSRLQAGEPG